jgi:hypothetical protein
MGYFDVITKPLWNILYASLEIWYFRMPTSLGGNENLDRGQICANLLRRPLYEINNDVFINTCIPMFQEKITSYCWVVLALWFGFSLYQIYTIVYTIIVAKLGGKSQTITIINEVNKKKQLDSPIKKNEDTNERRKATEAINKETRRLLQAICDVITFPAENEHKIEAIKKFICCSNPIVKRDIVCDLIGNQSNYQLVSQEQIHTAEKTEKINDFHKIE